MDRTRILFFIIIFLALLTVVSLFGRQIFTDSPDLEAVPTSVVSNIEPTPILENVPKEAATKQTVQLLDSPDPVFAPSADLSDGLPTYICGADAFGSYFTLQQIQMAELDVKYGFHLGIVPFFLDELDAYDVTEDQRTTLVQNGQWDCLLTTLDSVSLKNPGVITAIVDESAGADQIWGRDITKLNDLAGKRIAFSRDSVGEYFLYAALTIARLNPRFDVTLLPQNSVADAMDMFKNGQADVVSAWVPDVEEAADFGAVPIMSTQQMRMVIDTIVTSRQSVQNRADVVQNFHNAWFDALKLQTEDFDTAATQIANWGHNDWSFIYPESASDDMVVWLETIAQADLSDNIAVMRDTRSLEDRLTYARLVWSTAGLDVSNDEEVSKLINTSFVQAASQDPKLRSAENPVNDTFSISAKIDLTGVSNNSNDAATLAVLPCRKFDFLPESTELTFSARNQLDDCVVPTLKQSIGLLLTINGSSAWPENNPPYTEQEIYDFALARAESVKEYLVSQGIDPTRFIVTATVPPEDRRNTNDGSLQEQDRFVQMQLVTTGR